MAQSSTEIRSLETRIRALELECARFNERLRAVGAALGGPASPGVQERTFVEASATPRPRGVRAPRKSAPAGAPPAQAASPAKSPSKKAEPASAGKSTAEATAGTERHAWFEKGEAIVLFRQILKRPMRSRDLMARVVAAKRKGQLPKGELERFKWAVQSALKGALSANAIVRKDGMFAMAPATARAPGKAPAKAKQ